MDWEDKFVVVFIEAASVVEVVEIVVFEGAAEMNDEVVIVLKLKLTWMVLKLQELLKVDLN